MLTIIIRLCKSPSWAIVNTIACCQHSYSSIIFWIKNGVPRVWILLTVNEQVRDALGHVIFQDLWAVTVNPATITRTSSLCHLAIKKCILLAWSRQKKANLYSRRPWRCSKVSMVSLDVTIRSKDVSKWKQDFNYLSPPFCKKKEEKMRWPISIKCHPQRGNVEDILLLDLKAGFLYKLQVFLATASGPLISSRTHFPHKDEAGKFLPIKIFFVLKQYCYQAYIWN